MYSFRFFFFKQKTAYELRISDWSSDVCSSDLTDDQLRLLKQLIQAEGLDEKRWPARQLAGCVDRWKNRGLNPQDLDSGENEAYANGKGRQFYQLYQDRLKELEEQIGRAHV